METTGKFKDVARFYEIIAATFPDWEKVQPALKRCNPPLFNKEGTLSDAGAKLLARHDRVWACLNIGAPKKARQRTAKGDSPAYLLAALTLIKDSQGGISNADIARRVGVSKATISRNKTIKAARQEFAMQRAMKR